MSKKVVILGAGISGLSAAHYLQQEGFESIIYDKNETYGGLCRSFPVGDFIFDVFPHVAFAKDPHVREVFEQDLDYRTFEAEGTNYYKGKWIKHPAMNNLYPLNTEEKIRIIQDFINRDQAKVVNHYDDWLRKQYGDYFTDHFTRKYTRKYWTIEPQDMDTKWIGPRMYVPNLEEVLRGALSTETPNVHYSGSNRYPVYGGNVSFLNNMKSGLKIVCNKTAKKIDTEKKIIIFEDGSSDNYDILLSTLPLPVVCQIIVNTPDIVKKAAEELDYTIGVMVSLGFRKPKVLPSSGVYIYDENLIPARLHSPSDFSSETAPEGCSSLQAEVYFSKYKPRTESLDEIMEHVIQQLSSIGLFEENEIVVKDVRMEEYANIIFRPSIYENRDKIHSYLDDKQIFFAGRFGEWDYLWMDQSFMSGENTAKKIIEDCKLI